MQRISTGQQHLWQRRELVNLIKSENQVTEFLNDIIFARSGSEKIVKLLLQNNVNVNAVDRYGHTALDASSDATVGKYRYCE